MKNQTVIKSLILVGLAMAILVIGTVVASGYRQLEDVIISFDDDPIKITAADIYELDDKYGSKIGCKITLRNQGTLIVAFALSFMFYDIFNEHLSTMDAVSMSGIQTGYSRTITWELDSYKAWMVHTAIVSVSKVRLSDRTIWRQDKQRLAQKIDEVTDMLFKEEQLEEKRD